MSEQEEKKEEGIDIERAASFFGALQEYFKRNPKGLTNVLHNVAENLIDTINGNEELKKLIGYSVGQLEVVVSLLWNNDDAEVVQQMLVSSPYLEDTIDTIALLASAYNKLVSNTDIIPGEIEGIINDCAQRLYKIIERIITDVDNDP
jgi:hypothetical protein